MRIRINHVSKSYLDATRELQVLRDVTCEIPSGAAVAIVGRSGVGKSTMLQVLGGLDQPSSGEVLYDDLSITALSEVERTRFRGRNVGFVFQFHHLLPEFSALENVAMPLLIAGERESVALGRARDLLERVGLAERLTHRPSQLSGGEQQRVAIARALSPHPAVLLADEATGNLDLETGRVIQEVLRAEQRAEQCTMVLVTHNVELAAAMDMVFEMKPGGDLVLQPSRGGTGGAPL